MPVELYLDCPSCAGPRAFEQPPCPDGHGAECPELTCTECGFALIRPPVVPVTVSTTPTRRLVRRQAA